MNSQAHDTVTAAAGPGKDPVPLAKRLRRAIAYIIVMGCGLAAGLICGLLIAGSLGWISIDIC